MKQPRFLIAVLLSFLPPAAWAEPPVFIDAEVSLEQRFGASWTRVGGPDLSAEIVRLAESLPPGGAIHLPKSVASGELDFRRIADDVQITGGRDGAIILGGGQEGIQMLFSGLTLQVDQGIKRPLEKLRPVQLVALDFKDVSAFDKSGKPMSGLLAMFCDGGIHVNSDVKDCAWICGTNAFGEQTVTADARLDNSLFLWFGLNWNFKDYNAHLDPKRQGLDWSKHTQMHMNLHGGGQGTRFYVMVETNYGNPGSGVILENAKGVALYQGTTERGSSQGPGVYHLKNCENVQLGLRGINAFARTDHYFRCAMPSHDLTIEGGKGNILHGVRFWGHAMDETIVSSDPSLQVWACSFQFETKGIEAPGILRFAVNPGDQLPDKAWLAAHEGKFSEYADWQIGEWRKQFKVPAGDPAEAGVRKQYLERFARGRFHDTPMTAAREQALVVNGTDCTKAGVNLPAVPAPPAVPATDAPRLERPLAFTQAAGFGKALLDAGADPTGKQASDDAFAKVMYGTTRAEVTKWMTEGDELDAAFRKARAAKDNEGMDRAKKGLDALMLMFRPEIVTKDDKGKDRKSLAPREAIELPAGRFRLAHPLLMVTWTTMFGAGPDKTTLFTDNAENIVIRRLGPQGGGTIANLTVQGGRAGIAFLGADHHDPVSPTRHSYVAGSNVFNIHFKDQSFAGLWVGNDKPDVMGGAEHDQNKYVQITFENTGDYGIYMNQNMLDKWLCLNSTFHGQKKAGVRIRFNNVIKGAVIGCRFENITGPGFDCFGGNPEISYTPSLLFMDQCEFIECGNATEPALEMGHATLSALCHTTVKTASREIACGVRSAAQIYDEITVDVKLPAGAPAVQMRAARDISTARANGHTVRKFTASGQLTFVNDSNTRLEQYDATMKKVIASARERQALGHDVPAPGPINFDNNPLQHTRPPASGWNNPFFFHQCVFGEEKLPHHLVNADTMAGKAINSIALPAAK